ncbi:MAG: LptF/LptG family permease [Bacteroidota bacterium]|nr:LptF/LptG family permease [Bacteroidota bacterium]
MKNISKLVFKSYIGPLIFTFFISLFVLLMQFLWKWIEDFIGKGLEWTIITEILFYASAALVPMALPLAVLLASVMTFGNMGEHYELTALKASGISLLKVMQPLIFLVAFISVGAFFFSNNVLPYSNLKMARLLFDVNRKRPALNIRAGVFNNDIQGFSIKISSKSDNSNMMYDFMIYDHSKRAGNPEVTLADSGFLEITDNQKYMIATLYSGRTYTEMQEKTRSIKEREYPHRTDLFDKEVIIFELTGFDMKRSQEGLFRSNYQMMNLSQLSGSIDSLLKVYQRRQSNFPDRLMRYNYFKVEHKAASNSDSMMQVKDSLRKYAKPENLKASFNSDSLYAILTPGQERQALRIATEDSERLLNTIKSSGKSMHDRLRWIRKHQLAWYQKFSLSFACVIFFFIGAPMGAIIRKGGFGMPFLVSIILFMVYYVISITGEKFVREDVLPVFIGSWLSSAVLFPFGVFVTYKASTDSVLLNTDAYKNFLKKIRKFIWSK